MPRRKKSGQSPARLPGGPPDGGSLGHNTGYPLPHGHGAATSNFTTSTEKEKIFRSMQEMFSHLDPEVIYIVLSEWDFKVENAMDSLLELSVAAEVAAPVPPPPPVSGFERTAAALLSPGHFSEPRPDSDSSKPSQQPSSPPSTNLLTEELDLLIDQELEILTTQRDVNEEHHSSKCLSPGASVSSFPLPPFPQQALPELLQSSLETGSQRPSAEQQGRVGGSVEHVSGASPPLNQLNTWEDDATEGEQSVEDVTRPMIETSEDKLKPPLDLAASGRPSAFQVYKKQDMSHTLSEGTALMHCDAIVGGAKSKISMLNQEPLSYMPSAWNLNAPVFCPRIYGHQGPAFITPLAQTPSHWPRIPCAWPRQSPVSQAPLKPSATIPKSWALPVAPQVSARQSKLRLEGKVLVLLRGAPGSGKSTLARALLQYNPGGVVLSTDDYFTQNGQYHFDPTSLGEAHEWNHKRAKEAFARASNPIIIDNTNMQGWEMKPYVVQALNHGYKILFREPDTWWKNKPRELERRSTHNVQVETIRRMLNNYERHVTVKSIMGSQMPEGKQQLILENRSPQPMSSETPCPDLVGQSGLTEECKKSQLFSSLPDVSSVGRSGEVQMLEDGARKSTESLNFKLSGRPADNPEISDGDDDIDLGELDLELDAQLQLNRSIGDQRIPDCIVESVMNDCGNEVPVAFSESIGQRVKRERPSRRSGFDGTEPADLVKDTNQSDSEAKEKEKTKEEEVEVVETARLNFVGDWPSEGSLAQRQVRKRERRKEGHGEEDKGASLDASDHEKTKSVQSGPNFTEFQKLLDLIQTGVDPSAQTSSSCPRSLSLSSGEELDSEDESDGRFEENHGSRSDSEEREQNTNRVNSSRAELPDCVLDWKPADSCVVRESRINDWDGLKTENEASSTPERNDAVSEISKETVPVDNSVNPFSAVTADIYKSVEANMCLDGAGSRHIESEAGADADMTNYTEDDGESRNEGHSSRVGETCQSPVYEGSVETESSAFSGGSQERKQCQGRRSGKQCKLALTFTQNCPVSSVNTLDCMDTTAQNIDDIQNNINSDVKPNFDPDSNSGFDIKPKFDLFTQSKPEAHLQPTDPLPLGDTGIFTQTEPQDFALLWRLNRHDTCEDAVVTAGSHFGDVVVVYGDSSRFVPELSSAVSAAVAVHPSGHREVPYRVVHERGTQVEEKELGITEDRLESLRILSRHFKLVSFDTLEDLYDKCYQDLEWTTNLLLDSGERFFRDEDGEEEEDGAANEDNNNLSSMCGALCEAVKTSLVPHVLGVHQPEDWSKGEPAVTEEGTQQSTCETVAESDGSDSNTCVSGSASAAVPVTNNNSHNHTTSELQAVKERASCDNTEHKGTSEPDLELGAWGRSFDNGVIIEESRTEIDDEIASMDEVNRLLLAEVEEMENEKKRRKEKRRSRHLDIQSVELKLPTELALQLTELFGPVGVDPGACSADDYAVQMDLNLAKLLHQQWKETIQERQRQASLSFHLLQESSAHWGDSQEAKPHSRNQTSFLISPDGYTLLDSQPEACSQMPFMDHWNTSRPQVSLRDIIKEEQALQQNVEKTRRSRADLDRRDGATLLKENQLYSLFPTIDRHFLQDIFRDHNYSLAQTEQFLRSLLNEEPAKTVVAPEAPRCDHHRTASKEREKRQKPLELVVPNYQDTEDPEYEDFRAEASLQRSRQLENFAKAAEAYKQGRKEVASFYAQQGHLHGQRMREANHRAAVQIFERVNSSLLPQNILDLHGLHVDEALQHLAQVLQDKTADCEQGLCRPQLSVITGRGNHSQGGVARIRPAVIDYLTNKRYRFTEPKPGLVLVSLK